MTVKLPFLVSVVVCVVSACSSGKGTTGAPSTLTAGAGANAPVPAATSGAGGLAAAAGGGGLATSPSAAGSTAVAGASGSAGTAAATAGSAAPSSSPAGNGGAGGNGGADAGVANDAGPEDSGASNPTSATGTFPAVTDLSGAGPFTATTVNNTGPSGGFTLFYPKEKPPEGVLNPIVAWGNGGFTTPVDYDYLLPHLATHGFVVVASNNSVVAGADVKSGIDWIVMQNDDDASPLHQRLDVSNVSGVGYSNGGLAVLDIADDPRLVTLVIISGANMNDDARAMDIPKMHTPTAYLCTADDASSGNCAGDYAMVKVPAFYGVMKGSTHTDVTELLNLGVPDIMKRLAGAVTGWLRWQQMKDTSRESMFIGTDCGLCSDPGWTVQPQKNW